MHVPLLAHGAELQARISGGGGKQAWGLSQQSGGRDLPPPKFLLGARCTHRPLTEAVYHTRLRTPSSCWGLLPRGGLRPHCWGRPPFFSSFIQELMPGPPGASRSVPPTRGQQQPQPLLKAQARRALSRPHRDPNTHLFPGHPAASHSLSAAAWNVLGVSGSGCVRRGQRGGIGLCPALKKGSAPSAGGL